MGGRSSRWAAQTSFGHPKRRLARRIVLPWRSATHKTRGDPAMAERPASRDPPNPDDSILRIGPDSDDRWGPRRAPSSARTMPSFDAQAHDSIVP